MTMIEQERIKSQQAEVDAQRADFLSHVDHCEYCRADLRDRNGRRLSCGDLIERAQKSLVVVLLPTRR
jgi:hypothetical protein